MSGCANCCSPAVLADRAGEQAPRRSGASVSVPVVEEDELHAAAAVADRDLGERAAAVAASGGVFTDRTWASTVTRSPTCSVGEVGLLAALGVAARVVPQQVAGPCAG